MAWRRRLLASTAAFALISQNIAWATCVDGTKVPAGGFVIGQKQLPIAANWSPNVFTGTTGSVFIPDNSVYEHNDPAQPLTGGGHNWVFDQGSTTCKVTDVGAKGRVATGWSIPPNTPTDCIILPVIKNGTVANLGDIPFQSSAITPTCDPTLLSTATTPNPNNTYFNQLGCSLSHGARTTPQTATSFVFVAGKQGGGFRVTLANVTNPVKGGSAGKTVGVTDYYSAIPEGSLLTNAAISADGMFAIFTSTQRLQAIYACFNPMGDPGDPSTPINPSFFVPPTNMVSCMQVGSNNMPANLTTDFGPDLQPYFGGRRVVMSFNSQPGGPFASAWPNCLWQGAGAASLPDAFANPLFYSNGCGQAQPNSAFDSALITQPNALITHGNYMYTGPIGGTIMQFYVTQDPISNLTNYQFRTLVTGLSIVTGLGIAEDQKALMIYSDPTAIGLASQEVVTKMPLCEDMGPQPALVEIATTPTAGTTADPAGATGGTGAGPTGGLSSAATTPNAGTPPATIATTTAAGTTTADGTPTVKHHGNSQLATSNGEASNKSIRTIITVPDGPSPTFTAEQKKPLTAQTLPSQNHLPPGVRKPHQGGHANKGHFDN
jgi:hypothetical protein